MLRAALLCMVALAGIAAPAAASLSVHAPLIEECARLTLVETEANEASADVYISKFIPSSEPSDADDVGPYVDAVLQAVIDHLAKMNDPPETRTTDVLVQIDIVVPAHSDPDVEGRRVSIWVDIDACAGL